MATITKESYLRLLDNRPYKFDEEEVNYREGEGEEICRKCIHFYERVTDKYHTCEIFRLSDDSQVDPEFVCDFQTPDGKNYPFLTPTDKTSA